MTGQRFLDKKRYRHDLRWVLKNNYWFFVLALLIFLILIPFSAGAVPAVSVFNIQYTHDQIKYQFMSEATLWAVLGGAVVLGVLEGIILFRFVLDKRDCTLYFSLGLSRMRLFFHRCLVGNLILIVSICIPMLLSLLLNRMALGPYGGDAASAFWIMAGAAVTSLIAFYTAVCCCMWAGTVVEALLYSGGLLGLPTILLYGINLLMKRLYWGNPYGILYYSGGQGGAPSLLEVWEAWNPLLFFCRDLKIHYQFKRTLESALSPDIQPARLLVWTVLLLGIAVAALWSCMRRKAELAQMTGGNFLLRFVLTSETSFLAFALPFYLLFPYEELLAWGLGGLGFFSVHIFWNRAYFKEKFRLRQKRNIGLLAAQMGMIGLLVSCMATGGYGQVNRILNKNFTSAQMTYAGAPSHITGTAAGSSTGGSYYVSSKVHTENAEEIQQVKQLQRMFLELGPRPEVTDTREFSRTVVPYDIQFSYRTSGGKTYTFYYDRASMIQLEKLLEADEWKSKKKELKGGITGTADQGSASFREAYGQGEVYLTDAAYLHTYRLELSGEKRKILLEALAEDLVNQNAGDRYFPRQAPKAILFFTQDGAYDCRYFAYRLNNIFLYLTEEYTDTLAFLENEELLGLVGEKGEIESITLQKFDPHGGMNSLSYPMSMFFMGYCQDSLDEFLVKEDFGKRHTITNPDKIAALTPGLQNCYYMSQGGYLAAVKYKGSDKYRYLFLPDDRLPDFLKK